MTDKMRNEFAAYGLEMLKRSVLLVLYKEWHAWQPAPQKRLTMDEIREELGIPRPDIWMGSTNDLVSGVLQHLQTDGLTDHEVNVGWIITTEGVKFIED